MNDKPDKATIAEWKRQAGEYAVGFVEDGMVVGLGFGSTAIHALRLIGKKVRSGELQNILAIPTSESIAIEARREGIPLTDLEANPEIDLTIDGADEVDPDLNLIKGGGGALLREKIVAQSTRREIIVVDGTKPSPRLGTHFALPVEVLQFGWSVQGKFLQTLGAEVRRRMDDQGEAYVTDGGNYILDCDFGPIQDYVALAAQLAGRAGLVEHGLFLGIADDLVVADGDGIRHHAAH
jgi:ribose 5-phosphate isomerase A